MAGDAGQREDGVPASAQVKVFLALVLLEAITFLVLVSLFGLTGSKAPTAIVDHDRTPESRAFITSPRERPSLVPPRADEPAAG